MKKILLIDTIYKEGGPKTVHRNIMNSYLSQKFNFVEIGTSDAVLHYNPLKAFKFVRFYIQHINAEHADIAFVRGCLLYTSPSPRDRTRSRMPSSA